MRYRQLTWVGLLAALGVRASDTAARAVSVEAWGGNSAGQLGDGTTTQRYAPVSVSGLGTTAVRRYTVTDLGTVL